MHEELIGQAYYLALQVVPEQALKSVLVRQLDLVLLTSQLVELHTLLPEGQFVVVVKQVLASLAESAFQVPTLLL